MLLSFWFMVIQGLGLLHALKHGFEKEVASQECGDCYIRSRACKEFGFHRGVV